MAAQNIHATTPDACGRIIEDPKRLACYDRFFLECSSQTDAPALMAKCEAYGRVIAKSQDGVIPRGQQVQAEVTSIERRGKRATKIELASGLLWEQLSPRYLRIKVGDEVIIRRGDFGGYVLTTSKGGRSKVKPIGTNSPP